MEDGRNWPSRTGSCRDGRWCDRIRGDGDVMDQGGSSEMKRLTTSINLSTIFKDLISSSSTSSQQPDQLDLFSPDLPLRLCRNEHHVVDPHTRTHTHHVRPPAFNAITIAIAMGTTSSISITIAITTIPTSTLVGYQEPYHVYTGLSRCVFCF